MRHDARRNRRIGSGGVPAIGYPQTDLRDRLAQVGAQSARCGPVMIPDGELRGRHPVPSSEWRLHTGTHARRPDADAIVPLHPQISMVLSTLGHTIALITADHAYYPREVVTVRDSQPGTREPAVAVGPDSDGTV